MPLASGRPLRRWRHEFRPNGVFDGFYQNLVNGVLRFIVERPAESLVHGGKLLRRSRTPQCNGLTCVEKPAHGQSKRRFAVPFPREFLQAVHRIQILRKPWRIEFWIGFTEIVALIRRLFRNFPRQKTPSKDPGKAPRTQAQ